MNKFDYFRYLALQERKQKLQEERQKLQVQKQKIYEEKQAVISSNIKKANQRFYMRSGASVFRYIFIFVLCVSVLRSVFVSPDDYFTFGQFLNFLQNVPDVTSDVSKAVSNMVSYSVIGEVPSWLNWMNYFIRPFLFVLSFFVYLVAGLGQVLVFVTYFVRFFFGG